MFPKPRTVRIMEGAAHLESRFHCKCLWSQIISISEDRRSQKTDEPAARRDIRIPILLRLRNDGQMIWVAGPLSDMLSRVTHTA